MKNSSLNMTCYHILNPFTKVFTKETFEKTIHENKSRKELKKCDFCNGSFGVAL